MKKRNMLLTLLLILAIWQLNAQTATYDKVVLLNGEVKEGKVNSISEAEVQFSYKGETLTYTLKRADIHKIDFGSGRTEIIMPKAKPDSAFRSMVAENTVAVIPIAYIGDGNATRMEEMTYRLQEMAITYLQKEVRELRFLDADEVNAALRKKGIRDFSLRDYTAEELAAILQVEYVVMGSVSQTGGNITTSSNSYNTGKTKVEPNGTGLEIKRTENNNGFTNTLQNVQTDVILSVYNDRGEKIFNQSKRSILLTPDAYKNALHYLLKRTPLFRR